MKIGFVGLGKMGKNMVLRLLDQGFRVIAWNRSLPPREEVARFGAITTDTLKELVESLEPPRIIWLMLPAGDVVEEKISELAHLLSPGDLIIDGGNSFYKDSIRRSQFLSEKQIHFMDVGVSGGPRGAREGACLMVGGELQDFQQVEPLLAALAAPESYKYLGRVGAGHFAKMVHNGIEYGMMQALAEGIAVLKESDFDFDLAAVLDLYNHRSVIESRLVGWARDVLSRDPDLKEISSKIEHSGEGEWTVETAKELGIEVPVIELSLEIRRKSSAETENFRDKVVSALRGEFGGHDVKKQA